MFEQPIAAKKPEAQKENLTVWAKKRALDYVSQGKLKEAIDSMVSDLGKDDSRPQDQKHMIGMLGMMLRNQPGLSEKEVREFIDGFAE